MKRLTLQHISLRKEVFAVSAVFLFCLLLFYGYSCYTIDEEERNPSFAVEEVSTTQGKEKKGYKRVEETGVREEYSGKEKRIKEIAHFRKSYMPKEIQNPFDEKRIKHTGGKKEKGEERKKEKKDKTVHVKHKRGEESIAEREDLSYSAIKTPVLRGILRGEETIAILSVASEEYLCRVGQKAGEYEVTEIKGSHITLSGPKGIEYLSL